MKIRRCLWWWLICVSGIVGAAPADDPALREQLRAAIEEVIGECGVIIPPPGLPSQTAELTMVAEDPAAPANAAKAYPPAEKYGWERMIAAGRVFAAAGAMIMEAGTFAERNFQGQPFTFTGYRLRFTPVAAADVVVIPAWGRIGLRAGFCAVDAVTGVTMAAPRAGDAAAAVTFSMKLGRAKPWVTDELLAVTHVPEMLSQTREVACRRTATGWQVDDPAFVAAFKTPFFAWEQ